MARAIFLTKEQEKHLIKLIRLGKKKNADSEDRAKGKEAQKMLFEANKFLIGAIASYYPNPKKSFQVLFKAGSRGFVKALKHYDVKKSYKFSTYATWWIRKEIHKELGIPFKNNRD